MNLQSKLRTFSQEGIRKHDSRDLLLVGAGCSEWSWPIVEDIVKNGWLEEENLARLRKINHDLGMVVGAVVFNHTRDDFAWPTVCDILETSGKNKISEGVISHFANICPLGFWKFSTPSGARNVKRVAQDMAKAVLWIEALTFLDNEGFGELL